MKEICVIKKLGKTLPGASRKRSPGKKKTPDPKPNPIPNLTLTLPLTLHGGFLPGGFFPETLSGIFL